MAGVLLSWTPTSTVLAGGSSTDGSGDGAHSLSLHVIWNCSILDASNAAESGCLNTRSAS
eukprot:3936609-Rhodomonas_salina.2